MRRVLPPLSRAAARIEEDNLTKTRHFDPVVAPTTKKYFFMEKLWREFYKYIDEDESQCLQQNEPPPSVGRLKLFMEWIFDTTVGNLTKMMTLSSLKNSWYSFRAMYFRKAYNFISKDVGAEVLSYIKSELRKKGLAIVRREKQIADQLDVAWILTYLWCYDEFDFRHPRQRVQLSFASLLLIYSGARPGTIVESSAYRGSNEAICYKDFEMIGLRDSNGGTEYVLKMRFRFEKRKRALGSEKDDGVEYKWVTFREDRVCRGRCPVTHFFGLAFADDIFDVVRKPSQLQYVRVPKDSHSVPIKIKESKKNKLVLRHCNVDGSISEDRAMTYNDLARALGELGYRAKFKDILRPYNIRRGTANDIEGNVEVSSNQYAQLLGHSIKTMGASYISNISGIDGQGIVNRELVRKDHIRQLRSMSLHLNLLAPNDLSFAENQTILDDPDFVLLRSQEEAARMKWEAAGKCPNLFKEYQSKLIRRKHCYNRLHTRARKQYREQYFHNASNEEIRRQIEEGELGLSGLDDAEEKPLQLDFVSASHFPDRNFIANAFWMTFSTNDAPLDHLLMDHLQNLCRPDQFVLYYPGESPIEGRCPGCQFSVEELKNCDRSQHIHLCFAKESRKAAEIEFKQNCPAQCKWGRCNNKFTAKQSYLPKDIGAHIIDLAERQRFRNKESKRLNDKRRRTKDPSSLKTRLEVQPRKSISNHLKNHIKNENRCLWGGCGFLCLSNLDLRRHLSKFHGVGVRQAPFDPQFCLKHPEEGWYSCEFDWEDHCQLHLDEPFPKFNLKRTYHAFTAGIQCPFCFADDNAIPSKRITQFTKRATFNRHLDSHKKILCKENSYNCPVPGCGGLPHSNYEDLQIHLYDSHDLIPENFAPSRGLAIRSPRQSRNKSDRIDSTDELDSDAETMYNSGAEDWDAESACDEVDEADWEDISIDNDKEATSDEELCSPTRQVAVQPLKRKLQLPVVFSKHRRVA